ncbi:hypothetical protein ACXR0O_09905 [Verrucomicrobiota bacterium sgz303538]
MSVAPAILTEFPGAHYDPGARLLTFHPRGVLDDGMASRTVDFVEAEELVAGAPFDRYIDFSGITEVHLKVGHAFSIADRRRRGYTGIPVKSAFFAEWAVTYGMARLYQELMRGAAIEVCVFRTREAAAEWLEVPVKVLLPHP